MSRKRRASSEADPYAQAQSEDQSLAQATSKPTDRKPSRHEVDRRFRDLYSKPPDFKELSRLDPEFAAVLVSLSTGVHSVDEADMLAGPKAESWILETQNQ